MISNVSSLVPMPVIAVIFLLLGGFVLCEDGHMPLVYLRALLCRIQSYSWRRLRHKDGAQSPLRIWDTTGRERFSGFSTAFFRGVDAALLVFDASDPTTMHAMKSRWADFAIKPLSPTSMQQSIAALW